MNKELIKFFKTGVSFLLLLLTAVLVINWAYINLVLKKEQYYRQNTSYQEFIESMGQDKKISYAFFGDSHARNAVNPQFLPQSFNFGTSAENYIETYYKLKKIVYLDKVKIDTAIFEVDLHTFSSLFTDKTRIFDDMFYYHNFVSYQEIKKIKNVSNWQMVKDYLSQVYFPAIGKGGDFINILINPKLTEIYLGWTKIYDDYSLVDAKALALSTYAIQFENKERISPIAFEYFLKTIELAKENKINIVFIKYPTSKEFDAILSMKGVDKENYYRTIFKAINERLADYRILDYYNLFFGHPGYFADADHLNYVGADLLSDKISKEIKSVNTKEYGK